VDSSTKNEDCQEKRSPCHWDMWIISYL